MPRLARVALMYALLLAATRCAAGLLAAYNFDESSGTVLHDLSGNGRDGALYGSPPPTWVASQTGRGSALSYPGG